MKTQDERITGIERRVTEMERTLEDAGRGLIALAQDTDADETTLRLRIQAIGDLLCTDSALYKSMRPQYALLAAALSRALPVGAPTVDPD